MRLNLKFFVLYGVMIWLFGGYVFFQENFVYAKWLHIQGEVVKLETYAQLEPNDKTSRSYYDFTVRYELNGKENLISKKQFTGIPKFKEGDAFVVRINPDNASEVRVDDGNVNFLLGTAGFCGAIFVLIGAMAFLVKPSKRDAFR